MTIDYWLIDVHLSKKTVQQGKKKEVKTGSIRI